MDQHLRNLPDYDHCLVNLANSILKKFDAKTSAKTLPLADEYLAKDYQNVVVLLLDAMGISILEKHLEKDGFFRSHLAGEYDSVYPPTTVAATTSILSGLYPNEHGWIGWDIYYPKLDKNVTVFRNLEQACEKEGAVPTETFLDGKPKWTEDSLKEKKSAADFNAGFTYTPYRNIVDLINDAGGQAHAAMPFMPPYPQTVEAILERIETLCKEPGKKFIYAYWNEPDSTMHRTGTMSDATHEMVTKLEKMVEETAAKLENTLLLITADHSHVDCDNYCILDYPEIMDCLVRMPSFEPRTLNLFVKEGCREAFPEIFKKYFGDAFLLLTREEVLKEKVFGTGKDHKDLAAMLGDYVVFSVSEKALFNTHIEAQEMPGGHAGLTREEIKIPLIVLES
ncbi:MAG: alkaline phosphatase family protein [Lachnospiraceae bacterium]|nr:alkaline phosphatase family protein [Lachnospiraceae bacterium]